MTGYQSKKKAASAKTIDEVNWADHEPDGLVHTAQERNFCPRCGKRTQDLTVIHTCTPPQEGA